MQSSWRVRVLLPATQVLAEGAWLAVVYAAAQAVIGEPPWVGPLELAMAAWAGMAWGRRRRWTGPAAEALGLPLLAVAAGAFGWLLDPQVRLLLAQGQPVAALSTHAPGWLAAIAFWRGEVHRSREDDDALADQLLRVAVPGLAVPWTIGHLASSGRAEADFTAAAFVGTVFFVAAAFVAMGLARLEAVRAATGSNWQANRSWIVLVVGVALAVTLLAIPAAAFLGVPIRSLLVATLAPVQTVLFIVILLLTPVILFAALLAELVQPLLPEGFGLGQIEFPTVLADRRPIGSSAPTWIFFAIVGLLLLLELAVLAAMLWMRWQERRRMRTVGTTEAFEERAIVLPPPEPPRPARRVAVPRRRWPADHPAGAYLAALRDLQRDGRWPRLPAETPAAHADRARREGFACAALARLAATYQLWRYAEREITPAETRRARGRLAALRRALGSGR
ncbi:MAG TPA: DUF4129 domain-containing protein [candidate division Zixibacteria bacterium]|nr:DUF4129 domain-containing protein [candidate division Zixibacteria bacterium]